MLPLGDPDALRMNVETGEKTAQSGSRGEIEQRVASSHVPAVSKVNTARRLCSSNGR